MKAIIFFIFFILLAITPVFGQIKIGDNPQNIDASSVLELESNSKVLVITRVTTAEMEAITPQRGGMVYNTDTECINYYDGTQWVNLCDAVDFSITNDPIINGRSTIEITESAAGYNLEVAKNSILGDNIIDGGIGPDDIQDNSITQDKLAAASVGSSEISENAVGSVEIRDGSIAPEDLANTVPDQLLTTDENGIVQWEDSNDFYDLTFNKLDTTLTLERSTIAGVSTISLGALIGSDDQQLTLKDNILTLQDGGTPIDLTTYTNTGTDEQTLSTDDSAGNISISNGNEITLNVDDADANASNELQNIEEVLSDGNNAGGLLIKNIGTPTDDKDAVTKEYVDGAVTGVGGVIVSSAAGNDITNNGGAYYDDGDNNSQNELQDIDFDTDDNILTISSPLTPGKVVDLSSLADAPELDDGFIFVGNAASEPTPVAVGGDVTMNNIGQFTIENNTIESNNILNNTITLEDLNRNGATDGQVIKWDETLNGGLGAWAVANDIANGTGTNVTDTDANDGLSNYSNTLGYNVIVDDTTIEIVGDALRIKEDAIGLDQLNPMGATTNGQVLKWNQDNTAWELGTDIGGTLLNGQVLIGNVTNEATPRPITGDATIDNAGILTISADAIENTMIAANVAGNGIIQNATSGALDIIPGTIENQILKWNNTTEIWELGTDAGGTLLDGQVLIGNATNEATPQPITGDATIDNAGILTISADAVENTMIAANVAGNGIIQNATSGALDIIPGTIENQILKWNNTTEIWELGTDVGGTLLDGQVLIGNASNEATPQPITGDATIDNAGILTISADAIENTMIAANVAGNGLIQNATSGALDIIPGTAANQILKWNNTTSIWELGTDVGGTLLDGQVLIGNASNEATPKPITGDATIDNAGVLTISADAIENTMIAANVAGNGLIQNAVSGALDIIPGTAANQILKWNNTTSIWELGTDATGAAVVDAEVNDGLTDFNTSTGYSIKVDDTTIEIVGDNLRVKGSTVNGQVLQTVGGDATWQNLTDDTTAGSIIFSDGAGGIAENNDQLFWDNTEERLNIGPQFTNNVDQKLNVNGVLRTTGIKVSNGTAGVPAYRFTNNGDTGMYLIDEDGILGFTANDKEAIRIDDLQNVGIGPTFEENGTPIAARLHVDGNIRAEGAITASGLITQSTPDYVFQKYFLANSILNPGYTFKTLAEIEAFVKENNHLPGIQSAQAVKEQGFWNVSESSRVNLEKIEELFLHTIEQEKKIKELQKANTSMSSELEALKAQMQEFKNMLLEKQNN